MIFVDFKGKNVNDFYIRIYFLFTFFEEFGSSANLLFRRAENTQDIVRRHFVGHRRRACNGNRSARRAQ